MQEIISFLQSLDPLLVYGAVFAIAFIENIFPPFPSDVAVVFAGSLVGLGEASFFMTLVCAVAGSTLGFLTMYKIGQWFGNKILEQGKIKFIPRSSVERVEEWFRKYGYWLIVANRFLAGTRAVVSFFAGVSELSLSRVTALSLVSALLWNVILVFAGYSLGKNWEQIDSYLSTYSQIVTGVIIVIALVVTARFFFFGKRKTA